MPGLTTLDQIEKKLRLSIDHLVEGVQVIGRDWIYLYVNGAAARHGQRPAAELVGRAMTECYPGIDQTPMFARLRDVMDGGAAQQFRNEFVFASGERRWFELRVDPVPDGICIISLDVTSQVRLEAELREVNERIRLALRAADMGVWELSLTTGDVDWSGSFVELAGVGGGSGPGTRDAFLAWIDDADRAGMAQTLARLEQGAADVFEVRFRVRRRDGAVRWIESHGRACVSHDGVRDRIVGVGLDITDRLDAEARLQQSERLEAVGRLAGGIAHDFNNQLGVILGFCQLAQTSRQTGGDPYHDLGEVERAARRASELTRQLLAFGRKQVLTLDRLDVNDLILALDRFLERVLGGTVSLHLELAARLPPIRGDAAQVENILTNLAINARDAMPTGGVITISTRVEDVTPDAAAKRPSMTPGPCVIIEVADTGTGMDEATCARIFEPFFTTKAPGHGTGLGLATAYGAVTQMHGVIWVESRLGVGTTFHLGFPVAAAVETAATSTPAPVPPAVRAATILIVEDERAILEFAARVLAADGHRVLRAHSIGEARSVLAAAGAPPDLLLVDVVLRDGSGPDFVESLQPPAAAILMSGYSESHVKGRGGPALLEKPFSIDALRGRVREALAAREGR